MLDRRAWLAAGSTAVLGAISCGLALGMGPTPPANQFLHLDLGDRILMPGQHATFTPRGYLRPTRELDVISFLTYAAGVAPETPACRITVFSADGPPSQFTLRVGVDTAEVASPRSPVGVAEPVHEWTTRAYRDEIYTARAYLARLQLAQPQIVERVDFEMLPHSGDIVLRDLFLRE